MKVPDALPEAERLSLLEQVRQMTALLEAIAADRTVLADLPIDERQRLFQAVADVYSPDRTERRRMVKHLDRERKAARVKRDERVLGETGIRSLRRQPVFTTPNVFPPEGFDPADVSPGSPGDDAERRESTERQHCYVCKQKYTDIHHFYDQLCPPCAEFNFAKRTETGRPARPRRAAHRRAREDRLPGRPQAAARRRAPDRHHALPARLGRALRAGAGLRRVGRTGSRSSASTCATRRASRRSAASCWRRATGSTSSSTTPARRCAGRPSSTST